MYYFVVAFFVDLISYGNYDSLIIYGIFELFIDYFNFGSVFVVIQ